ncbi:MAG: 2-hydroxychromene-2-carboxylate isomerase [Pseudomonadales bacterium]|jgi:2-hydroxychromene-2-carboxylate isomerase|nr:2-hydroxychromene-2-carboxylate isomerase [Pseudomonadales bacterium]
MNDAVIDYWFDFGSPNCWLAHAILPGIAARTGRELRYRPMLLGGVFKATGNQSPMQAFGHLPPKLNWMNQATTRFVERHGVPYASNPHFPVNTLGLMRGAIWIRAAQGEDVFARYVDSMFRHMWVEPKKMDDETVLAAALTGSGFDAEAFAEGIQLADVKSALLDATRAAVDAGVFGAPTCTVGDQLFFGKDDIELMEAWLLRR